MRNLVVTAELLLLNLETKADILVSTCQPLVSIAQCRRSDKHGSQSTANLHVMHVGDKS